MNAKKRRVLLLSGTVITGTVLIFLDAPLFLVLAASIAMGALMLVLLSQRKPTSDGDDVKTKSAERKSLFSRTIAPAQSTEKISAKGVPSRGKRFHAFIRNCSQYIGKIPSILKRSRNQEKEMEYIDTLLDLTLKPELLEKEIKNTAMDDGALFSLEGDKDEMPDIPDFEVGNEPSVVEKVEFDENLDLSFGPEDEELSLGDMDSVDVEGESAPDENLAEGVLPPDEDMDFDFEIEEGFPQIQEIDKAELDVPETPFEDLDSLSELTEIDLGEEEIALDNIDLDTLEIEDSGAEEDEDLNQIDEDLRVYQEDAKPESSMDASVPDAPGEQVSFDFGRGDDSEIMDLLRAETKGQTATQDDSILRDMKGVQVDSEELVGELEEVVNILDQKRGKYAKS
jgi:hypothetical protein